MKEGEDPSISNNEKVDLDSMHDYFNNVVTKIENDMKRKPNHTEFSFVMRVEK